jgi:hypothetical protein
MTYIFGLTYRTSSLLFYETEVLFNPKTDDTPYLSHDSALELFTQKANS